MTVQITIIGMGQIGTSMGLALGAHKDLVARTGHDKDYRIANQARQKGALERVDANLPSAVEKADLVVLALPLDQVRETLEVVAPCLKEGAVVMDTAAVKEVVAEWAKELLPEKRHYIGLTPVINPRYLQSHDSGIEAARPDLFKDGLLAIVTPPGVTSEAIKLATDFCRLLEAEHLFIDPVELDSLMAATHILPQLMAAALLNMTVGQPGWQEGRKLAGKAYAEVTGPSSQFSEPTALASEAAYNAGHVSRLLEGLISVLDHMRQDIETQDKDHLMQRLVRARSGREQWWKERMQGNWAAQENNSMGEVPTTTQMLGQFIGLGRKPKKK